MWGIPYVTSEQGGGSAVKNYPKFADKQNKFCDQKGGKRVKKSLSSMDVRYGIPLREPSRAFQSFKTGADLQSASVDRATRRKMQFRLAAILWISVIALERSLSLRKGFLSQDIKLPMKCRSDGFAPTDCLVNRQFFHCLLCKKTLDIKKNF